MSPEPPESSEPTTAPTDRPAPQSGDVLDAAARLEDVVHRTPVVTSNTLDRLTGCRIFLKCENLQRTGSFKFRGAYNSLCQLSREERSLGVLAYSSGNHAQAIAHAGSLLGIETTVIMPNDAPTVKRQATESYGAQVIGYDRFETTREQLAQQMLAERPRVLIPAYDHPDVIAGQGTVAVELNREVEGLDYLLVCLGGGGLLSGCALAMSVLNPRCKLVGVEPEAGDDGARSFASGRLHTVSNPDTIADGARTPSLGQFTFPLILDHVHDVVTVSDRDLLKALRMLWERSKLVVEPTGALALAGLLSGAFRPPSGSRVGITLTGGNLDLSSLGTLFT